MPKPNEAVKELVKAIVRTVAAYKQIEAADYSKIKFVTLFTDNPHCVIVAIVDEASHKPLACGIAIKKRGDENDELHAEKISARRACADYARQNFMRRFQAEEERNLYHEFRLREWNAKPGVKA